MEKILEKAYEIGKPFGKKGSIPTYIPELSKANKENVGIALVDKDGKMYEAGKTDIKFTAQSIIKVLLYQVVLENYEMEEILNYMGVKGSSKPYNSIADLELGEDKKPVNPFINAGALTSTYLILKKFGDKSFEIVLEKGKELMKNDSLEYDKEFVRTGKPVAFRNLAIINTLKSNGTIQNDVSTEDILDLYFKACCILVDAKDLANYSYVLSNNGKRDDKELIDPEHARIIKTVMAMAGMYDNSGDFAVEVGIPAKSGVGGGILGATNKNIGVATYGPGLDPQGNSLAGIKMLEYVAKELKLNIY